MPRKWYKLLQYIGCAQLDIACPRTVGTAEIFRLCNLSVNDELYILCAFHQHS